MSFIYCSSSLYCTNLMNTKRVLGFVPVHHRWMAFGRGWLQATGYRFHSGMFSHTAPHLCKIQTQKYYNHIHCTYSIRAEDSLHFGAPFPYCKLYSSIWVQCKNIANQCRYENVNMFSSENLLFEYISLLHWCYCSFSTYYILSIT